MVASHLALEVYYSRWIYLAYLQTIEGKFFEIIETNFDGRNFLIQIDSR